MFVFWMQDWANSKWNFSTAFVGARRQSIPYSVLLASWLSCDKQLKMDRGRGERNSLHEICELKIFKMRLLGRCALHNGIGHNRSDVHTRPAPRTDIWIFLPRHAQNIPINRKKPKLLFTKWVSFLGKIESLTCSNMSVAPVLSEIIK